MTFNHASGTEFRQSEWLKRYSTCNPMRAKRDYAMLAMLFGCDFRRSELVGLEFA